MVPGFPTRLRNDFTQAKHRFSGRHAENVEEKCLFSGIFAIYWLDEPTAKLARTFSAVLFGHEIAQPMVPWWLTTTLGAG